MTWRAGGFVFFFAFASCFFATPTLASSLRLGIVRSNLVWLDATDWESRLELMRDLGIKRFRTDLRDAGTTEHFLDISRSARDKGLQQVVLIMMSDDESQRVHDTEEFRSLCGWSGGIAAVSTIDLQKWRQRLTSQLQQLKDVRSDILAFEIFNEIDWRCFNGDIPLHGLATDQVYEASARRYREVLQIAKEVINSFFPEAKILSAGMANIGLQGNVPDGAFDPGRFLALAGIGDLVTGIAEHFYPSGDDSTVYLTKIMTSVASFNKPIWITEFGASIDLGPSLRYETYSAYLRIMETSGVEQAYLYSLDGDDPAFRLVDHGRPTPETRIFQEYL